MRTMPRLTTLAALVGLTMNASAAAAGPEAVSLVNRDLDWVTAGSAETLRALTDDTRPDDGESAADGLPFQEAGRTGMVQLNEQAAPATAASPPALAADGGTNTADTLRFGVPGTVVLSSLISGINGSDGLAGPLGNDAAIGVLLSLGAGRVDRPRVAGAPDGGVPALDPGSGGGLSGGGRMPMIGVPGIPARFALGFLRPVP